MEKGNKVARVFVRKQLEFAISSTTEIYLDDTEAQNPELEIHSFPSLGQETT